MTSNEKNRIQQEELHKKLWDMANSLRGQMDASEFKNYILGVIFYRYLSEKTEQRVKSLLENDDMTYKEAWEDDEYKEALKEEVISQRGNKSK